MNHHEILAELEKRFIRKKILHAGVGDLPEYVAGGKVRLARTENENKNIAGSMPLTQCPPQHDFVIIFIYVTTVHVRMMILLIILLL